MPAFHLALPLSGLSCSILGLSLLIYEIRDVNWFSEVLSNTFFLFYILMWSCQRHVRNQFLLQALLRSHPFTLRKELLGLGFVFWKACCLTFILRLPMSLGDSPSLLSVAMSLAIASQEHLVSIRKSVGMVLHELS